MLGWLYKKKEKLQGPMLATFAGKGDAAREGLAGPAISTLQLAYDLARQLFVKLKSYFMHISLYILFFKIQMLKRIKSILFLTR